MINTTGCSLLHIAGLGDKAALYSHEDTLVFSRDKLAIQSFKDKKMGKIYKTSLFEKEKKKDGLTISNEKLIPWKYENINSRGSSIHYIPNSIKITIHKIRLEYTFTKD